MEKLIIEGIHNKNDRYKSKLTNETKNIISEFLKEHEAELIEHDIDFLLNMEFIKKLSFMQLPYFFNLLIDTLPQPVLQEFFNNIIKYFNLTRSYKMQCNNIVVDKLFVESNAGSKLYLANGDIGTLECKFYHEKYLKDFLINCVALNIQRLIIDEHFSLQKDYIEKLLSVNLSTVKEIIFKK